MDGDAAAATPAEVRGARWRVIHGDCLEVMARMRSASVDAVVTDPPYGLSFMSAAWDHGVPGVPFWTEALRVAKPGAHLLAFGGTRTFHRLAVAIEDAGWEIRDDALRLMSQDEGFRALWATLNEAQQHALAEVLNQSGMSGCLAWLYGSGMPKSHNLKGEAAGWGTALKPAWEPIIVARKPVVGTVARNVMERGTGALNIDGCRIEVLDTAYARNHSGDRGHGGTRSRAEEGSTSLRTGGGSAAAGGRWPANVLLDPDAAAQLDTQSGPRGAAAAASGPSLRGENRSVARGKYNGLPEGQAPAFHGDVGGASRFFYVAKASRSERNAGLEGFPEALPLAANGSPNAVGTTRGSLSQPRANVHPTVKPVAVMAWLCRLVTPPNGIVLDPFTGSGTTGVAAIREGFRFVGVEREDTPEQPYVTIARARIAATLPAESPCP